MTLLANPPMMTSAVDFTLKHKTEIAGQTSAAVGAGREFQHPSEHLRI